MAQHSVKVVIGGASRPSHVVFDYFCTCGQFGINYDSQSVRIFAESHERVANALAERVAEQSI